MNLCRTQLAYSGTYYHPEHELPQFIYDNLPKAWLNHHFAPDHMQYSARIRSKPNQWHYHHHLEKLEFPESCAPVYLLLALAALFASTDDVCACRLEERRGGKECVSTWRSRWSPCNTNKK